VSAALPTEQRPPRRRWRAFVAAVVVAAVAGPAAYFASADTDAIRVVSRHGAAGVDASAVVGDGSRSYRLFVPTGLRHQPHALLIALHPLHWDAAKFERSSRLDDGAVDADAVVVYPDGRHGSWDAGTCCGYAAAHHVDDVDFIAGLVASVERRVPVDRDRIAVTGFSNGALMSYRLLCQRPDVFRTAVVVAGGVVTPSCPAAPGINLLHVHGGRDTILPIDGVATSPLDASGFPAASQSVERIATADGCTGATTSSIGALGRWTATGCADNAKVQLLTASTLSHHYPAGDSDAERYGVDASTLTWSFLRSVWSR
jgi:polyhydroxybutyrate depolymerase